VSGTRAPSLSVVLLARDQAWNVDRLVGSVLAAADGLAPEVVLVDSASGDGSAEVAARHPIGVVRIAAGDGVHLTPAAGREAGARHTTGDLVLFMDGDMELQPGWLGPALAALRGDPSIAAVTGEVVDLPPDAPPPAPRPAGGPPPRARDVASAGGAALYRREALRAAGGFDPWLHAEEEPDLCRRLRRRGGRVVLIETTMALHRTVPETTAASLMARRRRRLHLGGGQIARRSRGRELPALLRDRPFIATSMVLGVALAAGAAGAAAARRASPLAPGGAMLAALAVRDSLRVGPRGAAHAMLRRAVGFEGFVRGLVAQHGPPAAYPVRVTDVRPAPRIAEPAGP
jgi:GT2 family glycosyltransferase